MDKSKLVQLFSGLCCSVCGTNFDENSISIKREEKGLFVLQIMCSECGKNFGLALLSEGELSDKNKEDDALIIQDCPLPIDYDDVLDAHNFIDKLEKDWNKYIPDDFK